MVLLQQLTSVQLSTFGEVAEYLLRSILKRKIVYFVTDQYKEGSIKSFERGRRSFSGSMRIRIERQNQKRPKQWAKFLNNGSNKTELIEFLFKEWSHPTRYADMFHVSTVLFINNGSHFFKLCVNEGVVQCAEEELLRTDQEEADTKVFLCASHAAASGINSVCISTVDTVDCCIYTILFPKDSNIYVHPYWCWRKKENFGYTKYCI